MNAALHPEDVLARLPHAEPFRFLTRLLEVEPRSLGRGEWEISGREEFLRGHFPEEPIVPGVLIAEAAAQLAGCVAFADADPVSPARLARLDVKFTGAARPPATISLLARYVRSLRGVHQLEVSATCGEQIVAKGMVMLAEVETP